MRRPLAGQSKGDVRKPGGRPPGEIGPATPRFGRQHHERSLGDLALEFAQQPVTCVVRRRVARPPAHQPQGLRTGRPARHQDRFEQGPPLLDVAGAVVEMNLQEVGRHGLLEAREAVADFVAACAVGVAAVTDHLQHLAPDHPRVRAPGGAPRRILDPGLPVDGHPAVPADAGRRPGRRQRGGIAVTNRNPPRDDPGHPPGRVADQGVLCRQAGGRRKVHRLVQVSGRFHGRQAQVHRTGAVGRPGQRKPPAPRVLTDQRTPDRVLDDERFRLAAGNFDRLLVPLESARPVGRPVGPRLSCDGFDDDQVLEIPVTVGEAPGHASVAPGNDHRHARQRDTGHVQAGVGRHQPHPVPGIRHAQAEVHVVRDQRMTAAGALSRQRPVVAADHAVGTVGDEFRSRSLGLDRYAGPEQRRVQPAQVVVRRSRQRLRRQLTAVQCRVPARRTEHHQPVHRLRQRRMQQVLLQFLVRVAALQVEPQ